MNTTTAGRLAIDLMKAHGLYDMGWHFEWGRGLREFGSAKFGSKRIVISKHLTELNDEADVRDTILHEIAHVLAGHSAGHGPRWERIAKRIGCNGQRLHNAKTPDPRYVAICATCGKKHTRHRMTKGIKACGACCNKYAGGRFDFRYALNYIDTKEAVRA